MQAYLEPIIYLSFTRMPRLHLRFFACDGDAIFLKLSRRQRAAKIACVATLAQVMRQLKKIAEKKSRDIFSSSIFCDKITDKICRQV